MGLLLGRRGQFVSSSLCSPRRFRKAPPQSAMPCPYEQFVSFKLIQSKALTQGDAMSL